jgi:hypothetical protein
VPYTISGVTFGGIGTSYTIANLSIGPTTGTFQITGTGTAAGTTTGQGGNNDTIMYDTNKPFAPMQFWGDYSNGIYANVTSHFADGLIVHSRPGAGIGWDDITAIASVTGAEVSAGNINIVFTPAGTGTLLIGTHAGLSCTGTPTSSFATVNGIVTHC